MDETACPLCGAPNECGIAAGASDCWCFTAAIPPDVLAKVPADAQGQMCVCRRCANAERPTDLPPEGGSHEESR